MSHMKTENNDTTNDGSGIRVKEVLVQIISYTTLPPIYDTSWHYVDLMHALKLWIISEKSQVEQKDRLIKRYERELTQLKSMEFRYVPLEE